MQWSDESRIPINWICTGWIPSDGWAMQGDFKSSVAVYQITRCERCTEEHNRLFKAWITTDSIKIFLLHFVHYLLHLQNNERRFQNCALLYNVLHAALRCSSFRFETVICLWLNLLWSWDVTQCCMLLKDSVFVLWIRMQFKDECEPGFRYWTFNTVSGVIKVTSSQWPLYTDTSLIRTLRSVPSVSVLEKFDCTGNSDSFHSVCNMRKE